VVEGLIAVAYPQKLGFSKCRTFIAIPKGSNIAESPISKEKKHRILPIILATTEKVKIMRLVPWNKWFGRIAPKHLDWERNLWYRQFQVHSDDESWRKFRRGSSNQKLFWSLIRLEMGKGYWEKYFSESMRWQRESISTCCLNAPNALGKKIVGACSGMRSPTIFLWPQRLVFGTRASGRISFGENIWEFRCCRLLEEYLWPMRKIIWCWFNIV